MPWAVRGGEPIKTDPDTVFISSHERRLRVLEKSHPAGEKGFTKAGVRKMIARLREELTVYEGSEAAKMPESE